MGILHGVFRKAVSYQRAKAVPCNTVTSNAENHHLFKCFSTGVNHIKKNGAKLCICTGNSVFYIVSMFPLIKHAISILSFTSDVFSLSVFLVFIL